MKRIISYCKNYILVVLSILISTQEIISKFSFQASMHETMQRALCGHLSSQLDTLEEAEPGREVPARSQKSPRQVPSKVG